VSKKPDRLPTSAHGPEGTPRLGFLQAFGAILAAAFASLPAALAGAAALLDPLRREAHEASLVRVSSLAALPLDAPPKRVRVVSERVDAWTHYAETPIGAVFLRWDGDRLQAFNVVCPHAGCSVNLASGGTHFACPCHRSRFALDGAREEGPAPRGLDELEVEIRDGDVWVRFQDFRPGIEEKIPN
jgi:menaquinol-cytochrome c reductase iron-sulfur subunit